jgi:hypothetical protein
MAKQLHPTMTLDEYNKPMTARDFHAALKELGLSVYASPRALGVSLRQTQGYAAGEPPAWPVANVVRMMVWSVRDIKARRKDMLDSIELFETKKIRMHSNRKDISAEWVATLRERVVELEQLLTDHPAGIKPGLD